MDSFSKYLRQVSDELKVLSEDVGKMVMEKEKQAKEENKKDTKNTKKESAQDSFRKISLKSLQPVTKMYKDENEIKHAQENPELDFISQRLDKIFSK